MFSWLQRKAVELHSRSLPGPSVLDGPDHEWRRRMEEERQMFIRLHVREVEAFEGIAAALKAIGEGLTRAPHAHFEVKPGDPIV